MQRRLVGLACMASIGAALHQPHIVFIVADDLGYGDLGFKGGEIKTPEIDNLARNGRVLENYYVQSSCSPTRAAIQTGRYPMRFGMDIAMLGATPRGVPLNETFLPQVMKREGYSTHAVGKWHLGAHAWEFTPTFRGYDTFLGYLQGGESYFTHEVPWFVPHWLDKTPFPLMNQYDFRRQTRPNCGNNCSTVETSAFNHYSTHLLTNEATKIIHSHNASTPLFLYLAYQAVHGPTEAVDSYVAPYLHIKDRLRQVYCGMVAALDEGVGNVTKALKQRGLWDNTLLIFTADNGGPIDMCDEQGSSNGPLKGGKCTLYEGGTRAAAFISGGSTVLPSSVKGKAYTNLMHAVDWFPTLASLAGNDSPQTNLVLDGVNHRQGFASATAPEVRQDVFYGFNDYSHKGAAVRAGKWKLVRGPAELTGIGRFGARIMNRIINDIKTHNYTFTEEHALMLEDRYIPSAGQTSVSGAEMSLHLHRQAKDLLFDISTDIGELHNVADEHPDVVKELSARLDAYAAQAPPHGSDPALSPQCKAQKPHKGSNSEGPDGMPAMTPYCDLHKVMEVVV